MKTELPELEPGKKNKIKINQMYQTWIQKEKKK